MNSQVKAWFWYILCLLGFVAGVAVRESCPGMVGLIGEGLLVPLTFLLADCTMGIIKTTEQFKKWKNNALLIPGGLGGMSVAELWFLLVNIFVFVGLGIFGIGVVAASFAVGIDRKDPSFTYNLSPVGVGILYSASMQVLKLVLKLWKLRKPHQKRQDGGDDGLAS